MPVSIRRIINAVSAEFGITAQQLCGTSREAKFAHPRSIAAMLCRREIDPPPSFPLLGREFGGRHHSTLHTIAKHAHNLIDFRPDYFDKVQAVREALRNQL